MPAQKENRAILKNQTPNRPKYLKPPSEEPYYMATKPQNTIQKAISEKADKILSFLIANGAKIFNKKLYRKVLEEEVAGIIMEESNKPDENSLIYRIKKHKKTEQNIAKQAKEFAKHEIEKIEAETSKPFPHSLPEGFIDARTPSTPVTQTRWAIDKDIGEFTSRLLKPISKGTSEKIISK